MMFKILVIQARNDPSDDRAERLIDDRPSFMRLLGSGLTGKDEPSTAIGPRTMAGDAKTVRALRERSTRAGAIEAPSARFERATREAGYIPMARRIVDAGLVSAPRRRNAQGEKAGIKAGRVPEDGKDRTAKLRRKDRLGRRVVLLQVSRDAAAEVDVSSLRKV